MMSEYIQRGQRYLIRISLVNIHSESRYAVLYFRIESIPCLVTLLKKIFKEFIDSGPTLHCSVPAAELEEPMISLSDLNVQLITTMSLRLPVVASAEPGLGRVWTILVTTGAVAVCLKSPLSTLTTEDEGCSRPP